MLTANIHEAKTNLSKLIEQVLQGKEVIIAKAGKPVAKIVKFQKPTKKSSYGILKGKIWMSDDFIEEDEEINKMFYSE